MLHKHKNEKATFKENYIYQFLIIRKKQKELIKLNKIHQFFFKTGQASTHISVFYE